MTVPATGPRLTPLPKERWDDDVHAALRAGLGGAADRYLSDNPAAMRVPNALTTLAHHPALAGPFLAYNGMLMRGSTLDARLRELMVLRVAWRTRSLYEWVQHARLASRYDITPDEIEAIARGADADCWSPLEKTLLSATDELIDGYRIHDDTWAELATKLDERQLVEVVFIVGTYTCLAMAFNSFDVQLDPELHDVAVPTLPE